MKSCLIISTYNWPDALNLVLKSIYSQKQLPDEILIADDGSGLETKKLIDGYKKKFTIPLKHFWQKDSGFRKSKILNKAIAKSTSDYIIQIDGDCIAHPYFIADHLKMAEKHVFLYGSRVNIPKNALKRVFENQLINFSFVSSLIKKRNRNLRLPYLRDRLKAKRGFSKKVRGCNISFWRNDFLQVNGYNEEIEGWGREDSEMILRMINQGVKGKRLKYGAIVYHLYHQLKSNEYVNANTQIQQKTIAENTTWCTKGIDQYLKM